MLVKFYILNRFLVGPFRLIPFTLTCWIGLHLIVLNLFLGGLMCLSTVKYNDQLLGTVVLANWPMSSLWTGIIIFLVFWTSNIFRTIYFSGGKRLYEILGWIGFWLFLITIYSLLFGVHVLPVVLAIQQIVANVFILKFLAPTDSTNTSSGSSAVNALKPTDKV